MKIKHLLLFIILLGVIYLGYHSFTENVYNNSNPSGFDIFAGVVTALACCVGGFFFVCYLIFNKKLHRNCNKILNINLTLKR